MAGRRTNLALLWLSVLALMSGGVAFVVGTESGGWLIVAHGVLALGILVLVPPKGQIAERGLARRRGGRGLSIGLSLATFGAIATGVILVTGTTAFIGPFTTMQLHVGFGLLTVSLVLVHTLQRPVLHRKSDFSRRNFLRAGGVVAGAGAVWMLGEGALDAVGLRGGERRFTGSHEISDPTQIPVTQWLNDRVPRLDSTTHRVSVAGTLVAVADITGRDEVEATLDCTGGWYTTQVWSGTRLDRIVLGDGRSVVVRSVTGYWRRFPIEQLGSLWLATQVAGHDLPRGNGGPVRLVAPGRRGYWWVKWVDRVEVDDHPAWWQPILPVA